jgi:hypothetical protein
MDSNIELKKLNKSNLPPIHRHNAYFNDPYKASFLMNFDLKKQQDEKQNKLM